jgi:hypothetical protein
LAVVEAAIRRALDKMVDQAAAAATTSETSQRPEDHQHRVKVMQAERQLPPATHQAAAVHLAQAAAMGMAEADQALIQAGLLLRAQEQAVHTQAAVAVHLDQDFYQQASEVLAEAVTVNIKIQAHQMVLL